MTFSRKSVQKLGAAALISALSLSACNSGGPTYITLMLKLRRIFQSLLQDMSA